MRTSISTLMFCLAIAATAQVKWAASAQIGLSDMTQLPCGGSMNFSYRLGGGAIIPVVRWFSVRPSLYFAKKGVDIDGYYGSEQIDESTFTVSLQYLELPILGSFDIHLNNEATIAISAGPYISYGLKGKTKVSFLTTDSHYTFSENLFRQGCSLNGIAQDEQGHKIEIPEFRRWDMGFNWNVAYEMRHFSIGAGLGMAFFDSAKSRLDNSAEHLPGEIMEILLSGSGKSKNMACYLNIGYIF